MSYLIDTDWMVDYLKGQVQATGRLESFAQEGAAISIITYGEIYEGIAFGRNREQHQQGFDGLLRVVDVLGLDQPTMERFAQIRGDLRAQGQMIGDLDILIAATALFHNRTLVTRNFRHFNRIPNLELYASE